MFLVAQEESKVFINRKQIITSLRAIFRSTCWIGFCIIYKRSIQYRRPIFQLFVDWTGTTLYSLSLSFSSATLPKERSWGWQPNPSQYKLNNHSQAPPLMTTRSQQKYGENCVPGATLALTITKKKAGREFASQAVRASITWLRAGCTARWCWIVRPARDGAASPTAQGSPDPGSTASERVTGTHSTSQGSLVASAGLVNFYTTCLILSSYKTKYC
jgi:hypothetical protein